MEKLNLPVSQKGFGFSEPKTVVRKDATGGLGRYRSDLDNASYVVSVVWVVNASNFEVLNTFFIDNESLPFLIDLTIDYSYKQEYAANFIPDSFNVENIDGITFEVSANLEVLSNDTDTELDNYYLDIYPTGADSDLYNMLNKLVNIDLAAVS